MGALTTVIFYLALGIMGLFAWLVIQMVVVRTTGISLAYPILMAAFFFGAMWLLPKWIRWVSRRDAPQDATTQEEDDNGGGRPAR